MTTQYCFMSTVFILFILAFLHRPGSCESNSMVINITDNFYGGESAIVNHTFFVSIYQEYLNNTFKFQIRFPIDSSYVILISKPTLKGDIETDSDCFPLRMGVYDQDLPNGDVSFKDTFEYKFMKDKTVIKSKILNIKSSDTFLMTYFQKKQCKRIERKIEIFGIAAYSPVDGTKNCPKEHRVQVFLGCLLNSNYPICIDKYTDPQIVKLLEKVGAYINEEKLSTASESHWRVPTAATIPILTAILAAIVAFLAFNQHFAPKTKSRDKLNKQNPPVDKNIKTKSIEELTSKGADDYKEGYPLHFACLHENEMKVSLLLMNTNINSDDSDIFERKALHYACWNKQIKIVKLLLNNNKTKVNTRNHKDQTPLHIACMKGYYNIAGILLDKGADVNIEDKKNCSPMHYACRKNHTDIVDLLLEFNIKFSLTDQVGRTPLHYACENQNVKIVESLLNQSTNNNTKSKTDADCETGEREAMLMETKIDVNSVEKIEYVNSVDYSGVSALHISVGKGDSEIVSLLLKHDANPNLKTWSGQTALHYACGHSSSESSESKEIVELQCSESEEIVKLLLGKQPCIINELDSIKASPLHYACFHGLKNIVELLLGNNADVNITNWNKQTPVHIACENNHPEILKSLLTAGADINMQDKYNATGLHYAAMMGHEKVVDILLGNKTIKIDLQESSKQSALHYACKNGHGKIVSSLLKNNADPNLRDYSSSTPFHYACLLGHNGIVQSLLLSKKIPVDINAQNWKQQTPLHYACEQNLKNVTYMQIEFLPNYFYELKKKEENSDFPRGDGYKEIVDLLLEENCNVTILDDLNRSALTYASINCKDEIIEMLIKPSEMVLDKEDYLKKTPKDYYNAREEKSQNIIKLFKA